MKTRLISLPGIALALALIALPLAAAEIHDAAGAGDLDKVKELLKQDPKLVNERELDGSTPLHVAARLGQMAVVQELLNANAEVSATNRMGLTALQMAKMRGQQKVADLLLSKTSNDLDRINALRDSLAEAILKGNTERAKTLINENPNYDLINAKDRLDNVALHFASFIGNLELIELFLSKGTLPDVRNKEGNAPIHAAAFNGHKDAVQLFLKKGVPVSITTSNGLTPLHLACDRGRVDIVKLLIENKADVNAKSKNGISPLLVAADRSQLEVAKLLLDNQADVNARGDKDATPLHFAVRNGDRAFIELLLANKADFSLKTIEGQTPLGLAKQKAFVVLEDLLRKAGAPE